jgi:signal transduction histidine kinase/class 3 adenylate cyclase/CheY-like chemotaxis protein
VGEPPLDPIQQEVAYYKRQVDELGAENLKLDYEITGIRHELRQKQQGFALLSELQQSVGAQEQISSIFETAIRAINSVLGMDRTVVLAPTERANAYRASQWVGFREQQVERFSSIEFEFPASFAAGEGLLVVSRASDTTLLINQIQEAFDLPYFVCVPVMVEGVPIGLLLSGRLKEARPLYPPLDQGDVDTFQAIAGLISTSVQNMRIAVLEQMDRLKTEFFANISHEFRTPITLTLGPLEQLLAGRYGEVSGVVREQLEVVVRNQERLLELINQILDLAKLEAGGMTLRCAPLSDMNAFVEERVSQFREPAARRGVELQLSLDDRLDGADLYVDREKLDRLLVNLLSNAVKFTHEGMIEVATERADGAARITVADTGVGIPPDELPHVFDRFRQADSGAAREYAGTGIGLALVKEIAELHGGDVTAHSAQGKGSAFRVTIPLGTAHLNPASISHEPAEAEPFAAPPAAFLVLEGAGSDEGVDEWNAGAASTFDPSRRTVLYAEDNADLRRHVGHLLAEHYNVFVAPDGRDALESARARPPDLILTDVMMPHVSGRQLLESVRADERLRSIPVILLTARAGIDARIECLDAGADDYVAKPFDEGELLARIRTLLRVKEYHDTIHAQAEELAQWNRTLGERVQAQVEEIDRMGRLQRFLSPQVAEAILSIGDESALDSHRREITVVFCDLRGFTRFSELTEPEEVMRVLRDYHAAMGAIIFEFDGTLEHFEGDGMMVFFNDPIPIPDPAQRAVRMAVAMRDRAAHLAEGWRKRGYDLDFGVGIALGYATLGRIGFEGRFDYGAVGSVVNLASRLGNEAAGGQILIGPRVLAEVEEIVDVESVGEVELKGFHEPQRISNVVALREPGVVEARG